MKRLSRPLVWAPAGVLLVAAVVVAAVTTSLLVDVIVAASLAIPTVVGIVVFGLRRSGLAGVIVLLVAVLNRPIGSLTAGRLADLLGYFDDLALLTLLAVVWFRPGRTLPPVAWVGFSLYALSGTISAIVSNDNLIALPAGLWLAVKLPLAIIAMSKLDWSFNAIRVLMWSIAALVSAQIVTIGVELVAPEIIESSFGGKRGDTSRLPIPVVFGFFGHPVQAATFLLFVMSVGISAPLARAWRWVGYLAGALSLLGMRAKTIIDVLVIMVVRIAFLTTRVSRTLIWVVMGVVSVAVLGLGASVLITRFDDVVNVDSVRGALLVTALAVSGDHLPLGTGFGTFGSEASRSFYSPVWGEYGLSERWGFTPEQSQYMTDLSWATVIGETGVIGAAGMVAALASVWWGTFRRTLTIYREQRSAFSDPNRARRRQRAAASGSWSLAALIFTTIVIIDSLASPRLFDTTAVLALGFLLALSAHESTREGDNAAVPNSVKPA